MGEHGGLVQNSAAGSQVCLGLICYIRLANELIPMKKLILPILIAFAVTCQAQDPGTFIPAHYNSQGIFIPGHYEKYDQSGVPTYQNPNGSSESRGSSVGRYGGRPLYAPTLQPVQYQFHHTPMSPERARYLAEQRLERQRQRQNRKVQSNLRKQWRQDHRQQERAKEQAEKMKRGAQ